MGNEFIGEEVYKHPTLPLQIVMNPRDPPNGYVALIGGNGHFIQDRTLEDLIHQEVTPEEAVRMIDGSGAFSYALKKSNISPAEFQIALLHTALQQEKRLANYVLAESTRR
ncbi:MAG: hypothetical protein WCK29_03720 [archaeon]